MSYAPPAEPADEPADEFLPGQDRPPSRWPVRLGAVVVAAAVVIGVVAVVRSSGDDDPVAAPTSTATTATTARPARTTPLVSPSLVVPEPVRLAIRAAYPGATTAVVSAIVVRNRLVSRHYGARTKTRTLEIEIESNRDAFAQVLRTPRSLRLTQGVAGDAISIRVVPRRGPTTQEDFLAVQQLIRDPRLLATD